ncbi:hypothetical protein ISN44_As12g037760 [Arabidopsis suecica]|uniref:Uncharacterized protein n=1 Tax=Arabidopsis suecica TaxID=45249 RepID=A0A8T1YRJ1_ARASU|nr:hypothetical protein ISN44_As12g037760 [Arabidopsis suecica]
MIWIGCSAIKPSFYGKYEKFARGKRGLCAAHNTIMSREKGDGSKSGLIGPGIFSGLVVGYTSDHSPTLELALSLIVLIMFDRIQFENRQKKKMMIPMQTQYLDADEHCCSFSAYLAHEPATASGYKYKTHSEKIGYLDKSICSLSPPDLSPAVHFADRFSPPDLSPFLSAGSLAVLSAESFAVSLRLQDTEYRAYFYLS